MLEFMRELREVINFSIFMSTSKCLASNSNFNVFGGRQAVTVGVVGGSDLVKISEQLGKSGLHSPLISHPY